MSLEGIAIPAGLTAIGTEAFAKCSGLKQLSLPASLTTIGKNAFFDCVGLESIVLPASGASIGDGAFSGCKALHDIALPEGLKEIGYHLFWGCESLMNLAIPTSVTVIGEGAFIGCTGLAELIIPQGVETIGELAFYNCSALKGITLPTSITAVGKLAFYGCSGLSRIDVSQGNAIFEENSGVLFDASYKQLHSYPGGKQETAYTVPAGTLAIGDYAFAVCPSIVEITLPDGVTAIGEGAFYGCSGLRSVYVPESLISIGAEILTGCQGVALFGPQNAFAHEWAVKNMIAYNIVSTPSAPIEVQTKTEDGITLTQVGPSAVLVSWDGISAAAERYVGWVPAGNDFKYFERSINNAFIVNDLIPGFAYDFYVGLDQDFFLEPLYKASLTLREPEKFALRGFQFRDLGFYRCGAGQDFWSSNRDLVSDSPSSDFEGSLYDYHILLTYDISASQTDTVFRQLNALISPSGRVFTTFNDVIYNKDALTNYAISTKINLLLDVCRSYQRGIIPGKYTLLFFNNGQTIGETSFNVHQ
jgi:hypothetical protein